MINHQLSTIILPSFTPNFLCCLEDFFNYSFTKVVFSKPTHYNINGRGCAVFYKVSEYNNEKDLHITSITIYFCYAGFF